MHRLSLSYGFISCVYVHGLVLNNIHTKAKVNEGNFGHWGDDWKLFTFQEWGEGSAKYWHSCFL